MSDSSMKSAIWASITVSLYFLGVVFYGALLSSDHELLGVIWMGSLLASLPITLHLFLASETVDDGREE